MSEYLWSSLGYNDTCTGSNVLCYWGGGGGLKRLHTV